MKQQRKSTIHTRDVKPSFWDNDELADLGVVARLTFIGLWCLADREGRLEDNPGRIRRRLSLDGVDVSAVLDQLATGRDPFIIRYVSDGVAVIEVVNFKRHQHIHPKEAPSYLPEITGNYREPNEITANSGLGPSGPSGINHARARDRDFDQPDDRTLSDAKAAVAYLNERAGRNYPCTSTDDPGVKAARAILRRYTLDQIRAVIDNRVTAWASNPDMAQYLRPSTIFRASKFADYLGQIDTRPKRAKLNLIPSPEEWHAQEMARRARETGDAV